MAHFLGKATGSAAGGNANANANGNGNGAPRSNSGGSNPTSKSSPGVKRVPPHMQHLIHQSPQQQQQQAQRDLSQYPTLSAAVQSTHNSTHTGNRATSGGSATRGANNGRSAPSTGLTLGSHAPLPTGPAATRSAAPSAPAASGSGPNHGHASSANASTSSTNSKAVQYGVILSIREAFGFLMPLNGMGGGLVDLANTGDTNAVTSASTSAGATRGAAGKGKQGATAAAAAAVALAATQEISLSALPNEHVYFSLRDTSHFTIKFGDVVQYTLHSSARGLSAVNLHPVGSPINPGAGIIQSIERVLGVVVAEEDVGRNIAGKVAVTDMRTVLAAGAGAGAGALVGCGGGSISQVKGEAHAALVPFTNEANSISATGRGGVGSGFGSASAGAGGNVSCKFAREDEVTFTLQYIPGTTYCRAVHIKLHRSRKDRLLAEQIKALLESGATMAQGVVSSVKAKGGFGFIQSADSNEELFFKLDDVKGGDTDGVDGVDGNAAVPEVAENAEVEYLTVKENIGGKPSSRAVHIRLLPPGTIEMEVILHLGVEGRVLKAPTAPGAGAGAGGGGGDKEKPGVTMLVNAAEVSPASTESPLVAKLTADVAAYASKIELWPRCMPELTSTLREGDLVTMDVHYYRPQKMFFARNVVLTAYNPVGREHGTVVKVLPKEQNYGFICPIIGCSAAATGSGVDSSADDINYFFRCSEVIAHAAGTSAAAAAASTSTSRNKRSTSGGSNASGAGSSWDVDVTSNMRVTYDVAIENSAHIAAAVRNGVLPPQPKYRAVRVQVASAQEAALAVATPITTATSADADADADAAEGSNVFTGIVLKEPRKDSTGSIRVTKTPPLSTSGPFLDPARPPLPHHVVAAVRAFAEVAAAASTAAAGTSAGNTAGTEMTLHGISALHRYYYYHAVRQLPHNTPNCTANVAIETLSYVEACCGGEAGNKGGNSRQQQAMPKSLRLFCISDAAAYNEWRQKFLGDTTAVVPAMPPPAPAPAATTAASGSNHAGIRILSRIKPVTPPPPASSSAAADSATGALSAVIPALTVEFDRELTTGNGGSANTNPNASVCITPTYATIPPTMTAGASTVNFLLSEVKTTTYGAVMKSAEVSFAAFLDTRSNTLLARAVELTDAPAPGVADEQQLSGVIVSIAPGSTRNGLNHGYIRVVPTDEKLFFQHSNSKNSGAESISFSEGLPVSFNVRLRGGARCAVNLHALPKGAENPLSKYELVLNGSSASVARCIGVVVQPSVPRNATGSTAPPQPHVVLLDLSDCDPTFRNKYIDTSAAIHAAMMKLLILPSNGTASPATAPAAAIATAGKAGSEPEWRGGESSSSVAEAAQPRYFDPLIRQPTPILQLVPPTTDAAAVAAGQAQTQAQPLSTIATAVINDLVHTALLPEGAAAPAAAKALAAASIAPVVANECATAAYTVGDIVQCCVVLNQGMARSPIGVCGVTLISKPAPTGAHSRAVMLKGRVLNPRLSVELPSTGDTTTPQSLELCHMSIETELSALSEDVKSVLCFDTSAATPPPVGPDTTDLPALIASNPNNKKLAYAFFCEARELLAASAAAAASSSSAGSGSGGVGSINKGDMVRFMAVPTSLQRFMAVGCTVENRLLGGSVSSMMGGRESGSGAPSGIIDIATASKRNANLFGGGGGGGNGGAAGAAGSSGGVHNITMAQGPPEADSRSGAVSSITGFPKGWREAKRAASAAQAVALAAAGVGAPAPAPAPAPAASADAVADASVPSEVDVDGLPWKHLLLGVV